jgi:hypothetical protein
VSRVYFVSETAQVELKSGRVEAPAQLDVPAAALGEQHHRGERLQPQRLLAPLLLIPVRPELDNLAGGTLKQALQPVRTSSRTEIRA